MFEINISSKKEFDVIDINSEVMQAVKKAGVKSGICIVYTPHATAAIIANENADPNIGNDFLKAINKAIPLHDGYLHDRIDNNAAAHIKASIIGPSETFIVQDGSLVLGTWQDIMLVDFDGPKRRRIMIKVINENL